MCLVLIIGNSTECRVIFIQWHIGYINDFLKIPSCERYIIPSSKIPFDFDSYSYIFVYGAKIKSVHWSKKETMFDEPKTVYFKLKDRNLEYAIIEYEEPDNGVYIYQIDHNEQLSKFFGP